MFSRAWSHRVYNAVGVCAGSACAAWLAASVARAAAPSPPRIVLAIALGMSLADLVSGIVHWVFDTWGTSTTPLLGPLAIRSFREHHTDERAMLGHDFVETNGHNFALSVVASCAGLCCGGPFGQIALLVMAIFVALTSQIHKWAHMERPPRVVRALQTARVVLPREHHTRHHEGEQTGCYCTTTGWLDAPLRWLRFFERLEAVICRVTGARPRIEPLAPVRRPRA